VPIKHTGPHGMLWPNNKPVGERVQRREVQPRTQVPPKRGLKDNWHQNLLKNILADSVMKRIKMPLVKEKEKVPERQHKPKLSKKYNTILNFLQEYGKQMPLSVTAFSDGEWGAVIGSENKILRVRFEENRGCINGLHYWLINVRENDLCQGTTIENEYNIHHCILLPKLMEYGLPKKIDEAVFFAIESTWMDVVPDNNNTPVFSYPSIMQRSLH
jgi:hypothetical protein